MRPIRNIRHTTNKIEPNDLKYYISVTDVVAVGMTKIVLSKMPKISIVNYRNMQLISLNLRYILISVH